ncbi:amphi-Trp domain-containing protein [Salinilacihabitans rarus]|uniref:amphi-Trp domain-containing protein n=1 Tax=Salinilacihabitans rarus TaxID=2961596 RepID=UPI0020C8E67B|nr:amphi-Trp domain-containing protein [Salinilacihabitans rarus]
MSTDDTDTDDTDTDDTELEFERDLSREEIADRLETFATNLRGSDPLEFELGDETATIDPPETVGFELELEDEPGDEGVERSLEIELEWLRGDDEEPLPEPEDVEGTDAIEE